MITDRLLNEGVGEEKSIDDDKTESSDGVEAEAEHDKCANGQQKDEEEEEAKLGVGSNTVFLL